MEPKRDIFIPIWVATGYFVSVFFAAAALAPPGVALSIASGVAFMALLGLLWLRHRGMDEAGLPIGLLLMLPMLCLFVGVLWWLARWLGLWG